MENPNEIIKKLMNEQKITKKELAQKTGINQDTLRGYIDSWNPIPLKSLIKFADVFNVSVDYLLGRSQIKKINDTAILCDFMKKLVNDFKAKNT